MTHDDPVKHLFYHDFNPHPRIEDDDTQVKLATAAKEFQSTSSHRG